MKMQVVIKGKVFVLKTGVTRKERLWDTVSSYSRQLYDLAAQTDEGLSEYTRKEQAIEVTKDLRKALKELGIW